MAVVPFLVGVMRSRASALRESARRKGIPAPMVHGCHEQEPAALTDASTPYDVLDRTNEYEARVNALKQLFADDAEALAILRADLREAGKVEIMAALNLSAVQYATIRRRMRRRINSTFPEGWDDV
jgi:hypothetical protein